MTADTRTALVVDGDEARLHAGDLTLRLDLAQGGRVVGATCAALPETPLLDRWWCGYETDGQVWSDAPRDGERSFGLGRARVGERAAGEASAVVAEVAAEVVAPHPR